MTIQKDIEQAKKRLIKQAKRHGIVENFGQKEVRKLKDKYDIITDEPYLTRVAKRHAIDSFDSWCQRYSLKE